MLKKVFPNRWLVWTLSAALIAFLVLWWAIQYSIIQSDNGMIEPQVSGQHNHVAQ